MTTRQTRIATACQQLLALAAVVALLLPAANVVSLDVIGESPYSAPASPSTSSNGSAADAVVGQEPPAAPDVTPAQTTDEATGRSNSEAAPVSDTEPATDADQSSRVAAAPTEASVTEYDLTTASGEPTGQAESQTGSAGEAQGKAMARQPAAPESSAATESSAPSASATPSESTAPQASAEGTQTAHPAPQVTGSAQAETLADGRTQLTAAPQDVEQFGTVGVTWDAGQQVDDDAIGIQVRTNTDGTWSSWSDLEYHDEHGPEAGSAEAEAAGVRAGTDPMVIGRVDQVQVRTQTDGAAPKGLRMAVVEPAKVGEQAATEVQSPEIDTATLPTPESAKAPAAESTDGAIALQSGTIATAATAINKAKQPVIYSRAQWGANEKIRDKSSLRYGTISGGFVHHTVNGNDYAANDVPGIIRSIYSFHVKSRGWSDIGYNFLIDKYGRIWEGRYGGVTKAPVGAHTLNYNDYSFAASAIGNYETAKPSEATVNAYAALFAWKLGANGVNAASTRQKIGRKYFPAINGHRDAASTACPGKWLYARIGDIRKRAAALQTGGSNNGGNTTPPKPTTPAGNGTNLGNGAWTGATIRSTLSNKTYPDLVVVRSSDRRAVVLPTGGLSNFVAPRTLSTGWSKARAVRMSPDLTGDRQADLVYLNAKGALRVRKGTGSGRLGGSVLAMKSFKAYRDPQPAGDLTGDGRADLLAWHRTKGRIVIFPGTGKGTFGAGRMLGKASANYRLAIPAGDLTGDRRNDLLALNKNGTMYLHRGLAGGKFSAGKALAGNWNGFNAFTGLSDFTRDGRTDLVARNKAGQLFVYPSLGNGAFGLAYGPTTTRVQTLDGLSTAGNLVGGAGSDLVARSGNNLVVVANADTFEMGSPIDTSQTFAKANVVFNAGDWDRDGNGDVITRSGSTGVLYLYRGLGGGRLAAGKKLASGFTGFSQFSPLGDVTGDGFPDFVATTGGKAWIYPGNGTKGLKARIAAPNAAVMKLPVSTAGYDWVIPIASLTRGAKADVVVRQRGTGRLFVLEGATNYATRRLLSESMASYLVP